MEGVWEGGRGGLRTTAIPRGQRSTDRAEANQSADECRSATDIRLQAYNLGKKADASASIAVGAAAGSAKVGLSRSIEPTFGAALPAGGLARRSDVTRESLESVSLKDNGDNMSFPRPPDARARARASISLRACGVDSAARPRRWRRAVEEQWRSKESTPLGVGDCGLLTKGA